MRSDAGIGQKRVSALSQELSRLQAQLISQSKAEGQLANWNRGSVAPGAMFITMSLTASSRLRPFRRG